MKFICVTNEVYLKITSNRLKDESCSKILERLLDVERPKVRRGPNAKYQLDHLGVGESTMFSGDHDNGRLYKAIYLATKRNTKRTGRAYKIDTMYRGCKVTRTT